MKSRLPLHFVLAFLGIAVLHSCTENDDAGETGPFDRKAMLANFADELIIPAYADLQGKTEALLVSCEAFQAAPSAESLSIAQVTWVEAYGSWQYANAYNFGPAAESGLQKGLNEEIGTFPVSESKIDIALSTGVYNLNDFNRDARGLLAVEYLLFAPAENETSALAKFNNPVAGQLLVDAANNVHTRVQAVLTEWQAGYRDSFVNNNGTDVGSSTSKFYNEFVRSFEGLKNFKVGLPLGLRPGQTEAAPHLVEAYYSGQSKGMLALHMAAIEDIWFGRNKKGVDGLGFEDYLQTVVGGPALIEATKAQLEVVNNTLSALPTTPSFSQQVATQPELPTAVHTELQRQTRFFKSDMSSLLGLAITFSSGDGD